MRTILTLAAAMLAAFTAFAAPAYAKKSEVYLERGSTVAVGGYDVVSYFSGTPVPGTDAYATEHKGAMWKFASQENLDTFKADPAKYEPQYGGYCAWAVGAKNALYKGDPNVWRVVDGKLYLNFDNGVQKKWEKDVPGFIQKADANWPTILDK